MKKRSNKQNLNKQEEAQVNRLVTLCRILADATVDVNQGMKKIKDEMVIMKKDIEELKKHDLISGYKEFCEEQDKNGSTS